MTTTARARRRKTAQTGPRYSRLHAPPGMAPQAWQIALRRQFGREQNFALENLGSEPVFSEFRVVNPASGGRYRVAIRGAGIADNYCSCPDFATNELGTCKHIEFALAKLEKRRGGKTALARGYQPPFSELYLRYGAMRSVHFRPGADCPAELLAHARRLFDKTAGWALPPERFGKLDEFLASARNGHELRAYEDALDFVAQARDTDRRREVLDRAFPQGANSPALAKLLKVKLYPYQAEGALFAARAGRSLIGDEMGLGKTVQAIAAAEILGRHFGAEGTLVICPASLKHQWELELVRFTGRQGLVISGGRALRQRQYAEACPWKIAAYDTVARDLDLICGWSPDLVILDEAQRIKNWNTIAARAVKRIDSPYAMVLTGTPLENRLEELFSIVQFVDRHRLGPTWRLLDQHQVRDDHGRVIGYQRLDEISRTLAPVMIRRRKREVLTELPERSDQNFFVPMTAEQARYHDENAETVARIAAKWRRQRWLSEADQRRLTCALQNMRMSCNSTWLLDRETDHGFKADELAALLEDLFETPDAKAVVFSQWIGTHEMIVRRLAARGWGYVLFHGGVPSDKRGALVKCFREDPECRVFLSTDAGGVGLNLQHAATVVNMDLPWNPAVLEQRVGRVHRMGQRRNVQVVNFIAQGTIEESMLSLLAFKKSLFAGVLDGAAAEVALNGTRLARFMESVEKATAAMGRPEVQPEAADEAIVAAATGPSGDTAERGVEPLAAAVDDSRETARPPADPWQGLMNAGVEFLSRLAAVATQPADGEPQTPERVFSLETEPGSGRRYLRLPIPDADALAKLADALSGLLGRLNKG
ncbi:MAG: helicase SNF2 [Betaproteobacteria bacterium RIFCSPLOWO2_12_FULL_62_58]|nr:MAG: helicase SNF2 [Betaproteobacteria bacterium RIFCSPLOWO2_12_FULL_62_58]